jgi:hypothetical protein
MKKIEILDKINKIVLRESRKHIFEDTEPGISVTNKVKKTEKSFNDEYYKETDKKFKDYLNLGDDKFDTPKVVDDENQEKMYGGSGMEGLTYDNEGTEVEKKFTKRVKDLNKPSKDYYLKKDEIDDTFSKLEKKATDYKKDKKKFQNTPPVRAVKAESTIKRLTYKTKFIDESTTFRLIPDDFKKNDLIFEMTDGNKLLKVRWEGSKEKGRPIILLSKDKEKISNELEKMKHLFEYNSRDTFGKTNLLTETDELQNILKSNRESKNLD